MDIYRFFSKMAKPRTSYKATREYRFFNENKYILKKYEFYKDFLLVKGNFDVVRSNIVIRSLLNKEAIEKCTTNEELTETLKGLPYYNLNGEKIYLPIYDMSLNYKLLNNSDDLEEDAGEEMLDPFDVYGAPLFNSLFTTLVFVAGDDTTYIYLDYDLDVLYFVNTQGRMDNNLVLFDRYLKEVNYDNIMGRLVSPTRAYLEGNRKKFLKTLLDSEFISQKGLDVFNTMYSTNEKR